MEPVFGVLRMNKPFGLSNEVVQDEVVSLDWFRHRFRRFELFGWETHCPVFSIVPPARRNFIFFVRTTSICCLVLRLVRLLSSQTAKSSQIYNVPSSLLFFLSRVSLRNSDDFYFPRLPHALPHLSQPISLPCFRRRSCTSVRHVPSGMCNER
jgi:hypothetical protein